MKDYLKEINSLFPIRKNDKQKQDFYNYLCKEVGEEKVKKESVDKNENIVIGNLEKAEVVFTAHYDTPASSIVPNLMMPRNKILATLYGVSLFIVLALITLFIGFSVANLLKLEYVYGVFIYLVLYFGSTWLCFKCFTNKNNANDNTSGVATVITLAKQVENEKVAFILFDNEEKGLLGSKAMNKKYKDLFLAKLVINFDCVGNGKEILFIVKKGAENHRLYSLLKGAFESGNGFNVNFFPFKSSAGNSDHKSFENGVGVMACTKGKFIKYYTAKIHTNKDVVADSENVEFLVKCAYKFVNSL